MHLLILKVLESNRHFVFALLIEDDLECARVVVDLEARAHGLLLLGHDAAYNNDLQRKDKLVIWHGQRIINMLSRQESSLAGR